MADAEIVDASTTPLKDPEKLAGTDSPAGTTKPAEAAAGTGVAATYKIVRVRKPDGTIVRVKRPMDPGTMVVAAPNRAAESVAPTATESSKPAAKQTATAGPAAKETIAPAPAMTVQQTHSAPKPASATLPAPAAAAVTHKHRSSRPFFAAFTTRAVASLIPDFGDISELHEDDEVIDDGHDDSDGFDDDGDDGGNDDIDHDHSSAENHQHLGSSAAMAGANGLASALRPQPQPPGSMQRQSGGAAQGRNKSELQVNANETQNNAREVGKDGIKVDEKDIDVEGKPGEPDARTLHKSYSDWTRYIIWFILLVFPLLFLVVGVLTTILPLKDFDGTYATSLFQATKIAVSAWPIIFAAIAAQSLRALASYKVERGIRLMTLEQLMGSNSVAGVIKQPFLLRRFNLVTIALVLLWSLSPLATQALQRMSFPTTKNSYVNTTVWYLNTWTANQVFASSIEKGEYGVTYGSIIKDFFDASVLPPGAYQTIYQDTWLRPKIPIIEYLPASKLTADGWWDASTATDFSSNYGIPLEAMTISGTYNFTMTSSYLFFKFSSLTKGTMNDFNKSGLSFQSYSDPNTDATTSLAITPLNGTTPGSIVWANQVDNYGNYLYSICSFTQTFVDSIINCDNTVATTADTSASTYVPPNSDCWVRQIRQTPYTLPNTTMGDFNIGFFGTAGTILDNYLYNDTNIIALYKNGTLDFSQVSTLDFTKRLARLINTYWQLGFGPTVQDSGLNHLTAGTYSATTNNSTALVTIQISTYGTSVGWLVALFICAATLLLAALTSIILDTITIVPDMLGYASSLARKSRYVDLPKVNSSMSGAERAQLLGNHRVMMQDVRPQAKVGKVALGNAHPSAKMLERGRAYR